MNKNHNKKVLSNVADAKILTNFKHLTSLFYYEKMQLRKQNGEFCFVERCLIENAFAKPKCQTSGLRATFGCHLVRLLLTEYGLLLDLGVKTNVKHLV